MTKTILITGGLGYIGGRIARSLSETEAYILRLGTHRPGVAAPSWLTNGGVVNIDLSDARSLAEACKGVSIVIHLAALNEIDSAANPEQALLINSLGALKLLTAAEHAGVERFVYFSTAHVYAAPLTGLITETTCPRPVHPYAITHRAAEDFVLAARDAGRIDGIVLRLSNAFGEPATGDTNRWTLLVNDLCRQAVTTGALALRSSGMQHRDFIPLRDVATAVRHLLALAGAECLDGLFNLGSGSSFSVLEFTERVQSRCKEVLGIMPQIRRQQPASPERSVPLSYSVEKLKSTGYIPGNDIDGEIDRMLLFCRRMFGVSAVQSAQ